MIIYFWLFLQVITTRVLVLIGTNIIQNLIDTTREDFCSRVLQYVVMNTFWYLASRCIMIREKELQRNGHALGLVKSAEATRVIIPPNSNATTDVYVDKKVPYHSVTVMKHRSPVFYLMQLSKLLYIPFCNEEFQTLPVTINSVTTRTISVSPKGVTMYICEIKPILIEDKDNLTDSKEALKA